MRLLKKYISSTISATFFPIFLSLFTITSVVYLVKIASLTSVITIDFYELLYLYSLSVPSILYYTLPITFFISMILNLAKLSGEYELIVISSFGLSPMKLLKIILPISFFMSIALFIISFVVIPQTDYLQAKFLGEKQQEAEFNIKPSEYGQVFGPWYIYVEGKVDNVYKDITLFLPSETKDTFVMAQIANIKNEKDSMKLILENGVAMNIFDKGMQQIDFEKMILGYQLSEAKKISSISDLIEYWQDIEPNSTKMRVFIQNFFIAFFPFTSVMFYVGLGFYNPRYEKNRNTLYAIGLTTFYMIAMQKIAELRDVDMIPLFFIFWIIISFAIYQIRIKPHY